MIKGEYQRKRAHRPSMQKGLMTEGELPEDVSGLWGGGDK